MTSNVLAAAANVECPAYHLLVAKGYRVELVRTSEAESDDGAEEWIAEKGDWRITGNGPLQLLGLACLQEARGADWRASDEELESFLSRFYEASSEEPSR